MRASGDGRLLQIDALDSEPGLVHGFSTLALGGMERRDGEGTRTPARLALLDAAGLGDWAGDLTTVGAVHGTRVVEVGERGGPVPGVDGLMTDQPGLPLLATFADCCPLLLYDPRHHAVALCHAGWRGTAGAIATRAVAALRERYGTEPCDLVCGIGPSICGDCYEVGPEVAAHFDGAGSWPGPADRTQLDVGEVNRGQLVAVGVDPARIHRHPACTWETRDLASHRRDHDGRRFAALVVLR
ncbi:MAG: laccase domain-containing protein [Candidatus Dormibacteraeota bacterium]|nr:laccase domain-containing protein [Candidatus Dormibacteraeota bacterium]MBO0744546.1 laccase domain-containing protein [Candidatus Dormibacteraeota bacterium]